MHSYSCSNSKTTTIILIPKPLHIYEYLPTVKFNKILAMHIKSTIFDKCLTNNYLILC